MENVPCNHYDHKQLRYSLAAKSYLAYILFMRMTP